MCAPLQDQNRGGDQEPLVASSEAEQDPGRRDSQKSHRCRAGFPRISGQSGAGGISAEYSGVAVCDSANPDQK